MIILVEAGRSVHCGWHYLLGRRYCVRVEEVGRMQFFCLFVFERSIHVSQTSLELIMQTRMESKVSHSPGPPMHSRKTVSNPGSLSDIPSSSLTEIILVGPLDTPSLVTARPGAFSRPPSRQFPPRKMGPLSCYVCTFPPELDSVSCAPKFLDWDSVQTISLFLFVE